MKSVKRTMKQGPVCSHLDSLLGHVSVNFQELILVLLVGDFEQGDSLNGFGGCHGECNNLFWLNDCTNDDQF